MPENGTAWVRFDWPLTNRTFDASIAEGYRLRPANSGDLDAMRAVVASAYRSDPQWAGMTVEIERRVMARVGARIAYPDAHFLLAE